MSKLVIFLTVCLIITLSNASKAVENKLRKRMFKTYGQRYDKQYNSNAEFNYRAEIYQKRMDDIDNFNDEESDWQKGETIFTDMTDDERQQYVSVFPVDDTLDSDSFPQDESNDNTPLLSSTTATPFDALPKTVNWLAKGILTPVRAQGACGSCWAHATTAAVESLLKVKNGTDTDLSEQELVDCAVTSPYNSYGCKGGSNTAGFNYYKIKGSHPETQYPYTAKNGTCKVLTTPSVKISSFTVVKPKSLVELLKAIAKGPVAVSYYAAFDFYDYKSGIYNHKLGCKTATTVNHAVLAVGYDLNPTKPYILFKNSWGATFGEKGYFRMSMDLVDVGDGPCNLTKYGMSAYATL